jgi:dihydrolipoamide dehydrogenase
MAGTYSRSTRVLVIGGGPGGYVAAIRLGQLGQKTLLVERGELGGECLNRGCIPSKALLHASYLYHQARVEGPEVGVIAPNLSFDLEKTQTWKSSVLAKERQGVATLLKAAGVTVLFGEAKFTGPRTVELTAPDGGRERIDFEQAVVATGSSPIVLPGFEPDGARVLIASDVLNLRKIPASMIVLGGGVSGCELGQFLARIGVEVTIVELLPEILPGLEPDLARELHRTLDQMGVKVRTATKAVRLVRGPSSVTLSVEHGGATEEISAESLFLTIGKRPETANLSLEEAGVTPTSKAGFLAVNDRQQTNVPMIFAVGDCARPPMLAHKAYREGVVAAEAIAGLPTRFQFQCIPSVVFTAPELSSVGLTLEAALRQGPGAREVRFPYAALGRAHAAHATGGWVKLVGDDATGAILGFHAAGEAAGEFAAEAGLAIEMGATVRDVALTIHPHPTFSETVQEAALLWLGEPMHVARRTGAAGRP